VPRASDAAREPHRPGHPICARRSRAVPAGPPAWAPPWRSWTPLATP